MNIYCLLPYNLSIYAITLKFTIANKSHKIDDLKNNNKRSIVIHKQTEYKEHTTKNTIL